jgi:uncharacterized protein (TIGR00297 family)
MQIFLGLIFGILISTLAWRAGSLSISGAISAAIVGSLIFGLGGLAWGVLLLGFFISSSLLSRAFRKQKSGLSEKFSKGNQRDWAQVFANGGFGTLLVILFSLTPEREWPWFAYVGAMAAVNADTWATELGVLNPTAPRLITNRKKVEPGTSGGVSLTGLLASLSGGALIALFGVLFTPSGEKWLLGLSATAAGFLGSIFDSLLGATVQAIYICPTCQKETERHPQHTCGSETHQIRGWKWLGNDAVNFAASLLGAIIPVAMWHLFT